MGQKTKKRNNLSPWENPHWQKERKPKKKKKQIKTALVTPIFGKYVDWADDFWKTKPSVTFAKPEKSLYDDWPTVNFYWTENGWKEDKRTEIISEDAVQETICFEQQQIFAPDEYWYPFLEIEQWQHKEAIADI